VKVTIDPAKCQGHTRCVLTTPAVFDFNSEGRGEVIEPHPDESLAADIEQAVLSCPEQAITVAK
jgi:ferredoxin